MAPNMIPIVHQPRDETLGWNQKEPKQNATLEYLNTFKESRKGLESIARANGVDEDQRRSMSTQELTKKYMRQNSESQKIGNASYEDFMVAQAAHSGVKTTQRGFFGGKTEKSVSRLMDLTDENFSKEKREQVEIAWANQIDSGLKMAEEYNALSPQAKLAVDHEMKVEKGHMDSGSFQYKRGSEGMLSTGQGLTADREAYFKNRMQSAIAQGSKIDADVKKSGTEAEAAKIQDPEMRKKFITQAYKEQFSEKFSNFRSANSSKNDADSEYHAALWNLGDKAITAASLVALPGAIGAQIATKGFMAGGKYLAQQAVSSTVKEGGKFGATIAANEGIKSGNALLQQTNAPEFLKTIGSVAAGASESYTQDKYGNIDIRDPRSILNGQMAANVNPFFIAQGGRTGVFGAASKASHTGLSIVGNTMNAAGIVEGVSKVGNTIRNFDHEVNVQAQELDRLPENKGKSQEQLRAMAKQQVIQRTTTDIGDVGFSTKDLRGNFQKSSPTTKAEYTSAKEQARENPNLNNPDYITAMEYTNAANEARDSGTALPKDVRRLNRAADEHFAKALKTDTREKVLENRFFGDAKTKDISKEKDDTPTKDDIKEDPTKDRVAEKDKVPHVAQDPNREIAPPLPPAAAAGVGGGGFSSAAMSGYPSLVNPSYNTVQIQLPYFSELGL